MRIYRASALGGCMKAQVAGHLGMVALDTSKQMEDLGREGNLHEGEVLARISDDASKIYDEQAEVNLEVLPGVVVQGHIDAKGLWVGVTALNRVIEVKSMGKDPYAAWLKSRWDTPGLVQKYKWQVSAYMLGTGLPLLFAVKDRNSGKLDLSTVDEPFYTLDEIRGRVLAMERMVRLGELPDSCDVSQFPCPFFYLHEQTSLEVTEDDTLEALGLAYDEARLGEKRAKAVKDETRKALDVALAGRERVATERVVVGYSTTSRMQPRIEAMKEDGVLEKYMEKVEGKQLNVRVVEVKDADD